MRQKSHNLLAVAALIISLICCTIAEITVSNQVSAAAVLASFSFNKTDGVSTAKDLNDTYKTNADSGYAANAGKYAGLSKLYASVNSPSDSSYRKLEWSKDSDYSYNKIAQKAMPIMTASTKNPWGSNPFFLIKTSTKGYDKLSISLRLGGTKKGPKEYKLQYSTNGSSYTNISGTDISLNSNKTMYDFNFSLPSSAADQSTVYIKIVTSSTATIEGNTLTADTGSGEAAINNISINGSEVSTNTEKATESPAAKATTRPSTNSSSVSDNKSNNSVSAQTTAAPGNNNLKTLTMPKLKTYKRGSKIVKGTALKGANVTVTIGSKKYTAKVSSKGTFKVSLKYKLKKGRIIKVYASKTGYNNSKTRSCKVK